MTDNTVPQNDTQEENTEPSFTPGPWQALSIFDTSGKKIYFIEAIGSDLPNVVDWEWVIERKPDADFIAAAPDMYEALKAVQPLLPAVWAYSEAAKPVLEMIAAALLKARGGK